MLLTTRDISPGILGCRLDLRMLYTDERDRAKFEERWASFYASDQAHSAIYSRAENDALAYCSESLIPTKADDRPPLLLLGGNPASHSISAGMCFAFEGDKKEHRFWVGLRKAGLLDFREVASSDTFTPDKRNVQRKQQIFDLDYDSPFRMGITVFYTPPSPASRTAWAGVNGLRKLFGKEALDRIVEAEQRRIAQIVTSFMPQSGGMLVFQRDAYEAVRGITDTPYALNLALAGELHGTYRHHPNVHAVGVAPTRYMYSDKMCNSLIRYASFLQGYCI
jgi:hypothetical protein